MGIYTEHAKRFLENCGIRIMESIREDMSPCGIQSLIVHGKIVLRREDRQKGGKARNLYHVLSVPCRPAQDAHRL